MNGPAAGVSFARLRGFSKLFATYCERWDRLSEYFVADWRDDGSYRTLAAQIGTPVSGPVVHALARQNVSWENPVDAQIAALRKPGTLAVVTGQQVGLYCGPLYTLYKAITAVRLAERLSSLLGRAVVPVFWLEGGDHDLDEVSCLTLPVRNEVRQLCYRGQTRPGSGNVGSVGKLAFSADIERIRDELRQGLPDTEYRSTALDRYFEAYQTGTTFTDAFARSMAALLQGLPLVLMNPEDPEIKQQAAPLFERALTEHADVQAHLECTSQSLKTDYHMQVKPQPTCLFFENERGRNAVRPGGVGFMAEGMGSSVPAEEVLDHIRTRPQRFSPNVVLRPLVQDTLLPTVAYVAGPGEVAYFAQLRRVYAWAGIPMPIIYPRASVTVLEPRTVRTMRKRGLGLVEVSEDVEALLARLVVQGSGVDAAFGSAVRSLQRTVESLIPAVTGVDPTLERTAKGVHAAWLKDLRKLQNRVVRAEKRKHDALRSQLVHCRHSVFPSGKMQERVLPAIYYLSKYGPHFLETLFRGISLQTSRHQTLVL